MLNSFFGPALKQGPSITEVSGVNFRNFNDDLMTLYGTSTPGKYMFRRTNSNKFVTDNFFLLELDFLITKILQSRNIWSNRKVLHQLQINLRTNSWVKDTQDITIPPINNQKLFSKVKMKPYDTQRQFLEQYPVIKKAFHLKGQLLDGRPGSGKTALSLMWGVLNGNAKHIILSPSVGVDSIWRNHIENIVFHKKPKVWTTWDKTPPDPNAEYYVFHHEFLRTDTFFHYLDLIFKAPGGKGIDIVIDECHNFNELSAKQTQNLIKAFDHYDFADTLPMSGTPIKAIGREAYTVFAGIDPFFKGNARERFMKSYGLSRDRLNLLLAHRLGKTRYIINSLADMGEEPDLVIKPVKFPGCEKYTLKAIRLEMLTYIQNRVGFYETNMPKFVEFFYRVVDDYEEKNKRDSSTLAEVAKYKKIVHRFRTQGFNSFADSEDSKFCKSVEEKIEKGIRGDELKSFRSIKSAVKYVALKIKGEALGNVLGKARMNSIRDIIQYAGLPEMINNVEKKTLIFTSYVDVLTECEKYLKTKGFSPVTVYGENNDIRDDEIKRFAADPKINPCITTFKSLREGAHMTMANQEILMNAPWRDYEIKQTKARIFRQGQDAQTFFWLISLDTGGEENITSRSIDIMQWSADNVNEILSAMCIDVPSLRSVSGDEEFIAIMDHEPTPDFSVLSPVSMLDLF